VCRDRAGQFCEFSASYGTKPGQKPLPPWGALQPGPRFQQIGDGDGVSPRFRTNPGRGRGSVPATVTGQIGDGRPVPVPGQIGDGRPVPVPGRIGDGVPWGRGPGCPRPEIPGIREIGNPDLAGIPGFGKSRSRFGRDRKNPPRCPGIWGCRGLRALPSGSPRPPPLRPGGQRGAGASKSPAAGASLGPEGGPGPGSEGRMAGVVPSDLHPRACSKRLFSCDGPTFKLPLKIYADHGALAV
jgi:hypothetical protein